MRVKCLGQEHSTMSPAWARTLHKLSENYSLMSYQSSLVRHPVSYWFLMASFVLSFVYCFDAFFDRLQDNVQQFL